MPRRLHLAVAARPATPVVLSSLIRPEVTTVGDLYDESLRLAASLIGLGVAAGDVVAVQLPNGRECIVSHAAAWLCGAVILPIVPSYGPWEVGYALRHSMARVFIGARTIHQRDTARIFAAGAQAPAVTHLVVVGAEAPGCIPYHELTHTSGSAVMPVGTEPGDRCTLVYTSGTTSAPKAVLHTHASLLGELDALADMRAGTSRSVTLAAFPPGHIAGVLAILRMLTGPEATVVMDRWDPQIGARLIVEHGVEASAGAPIHLQGLLDAAAQHHLDLSSVRDYMTGAAGVSPALIRRADAAGITAYRCYGSTDIPTVTLCTGNDPLDKRADTDGRPSSGSQIRIVDGVVST